MSKKNRYKFRNRDRNQRNHSPISSSSVNNSTTYSAGQGSGGAVSQHAAEYRVIRGDMIRLVVLNGLVLAAVLVVYYTNRSSGYLERLFERIF